MDCPKPTPPLPAPDADERRSPVSPSKLLHKAFMVMWDGKETFTTKTPVSICAALDMAALSEAMLETRTLEQSTAIHSVNLMLQNLIQLRLGRGADGRYGQLTVYRWLATTIPDQYAMAMHKPQIEQGPIFQTYRARWIESLISEFEAQGR